MRLRTCETPVAVVRWRRKNQARILGWRVLMLGFALALGAILAFAVGKVAECSIAGDAGSYDVSSAALPAPSYSGPAEFAPSHPADGKSELIAPAWTGSAVGQCHHGNDHKHNGAVSKMDASSPRGIDHVSATVHFGGFGWSAAGALFVFGLRRRGRPGTVCRSCPSGRHILIAECVART